MFSTAGVPSATTDEPDAGAPTWTIEGDGPSAAAGSTVIDDAAAGKATTTPASANARRKVMMQTPFQPSLASYSDAALRCR